MLMGVCTDCDVIIGDCEGVTECARKDKRDATQGIMQRVQE